MSKRKRSFWDDMSEFFLVAIMITYFIIANAFLGASEGRWSYDHAEIFSQGMFILLGVVVAAGALFFGIDHLHRRLNPPPPPPAKTPLPQRWRKAKNDQVSHTRRNDPTSNLPF